MKVVKEILRPSFLIITILVVLLEIMIFFIIHYISRDPIDISFSSIKESLNKTVTTGIESLTRLFSEKIEKIAINLLLIGRHISLFADITVVDGPKILKNSPFYSSFKDCLVSQDKISTDSDLSKYYNKQERNFDYTEELKLIYNLNKSQDEIISDLLNKTPFLNKISYYNPNKLNDISHLSHESNVSICSITSMMKTIFIKEYIAYKEKIGLERFLIIKNDTLLIYPPNYYNNTYLYNNNFFNNNIHCLDNKDFLDCFNLPDDSNNTNKFYFPQLKYSNKKIILTICLKSQFDNSRVFLCEEIDFTLILENYKIPSEEVITMGFFNEKKLPKNKPCYSVFFSNTNINTDFFIVPEFEEYQFTETNGINLLHLLYSDIAKNNNYYKNITNIKNDYKEIEKKLTYEIEKTTSNLSLGNYNNITKLINVQKIFYTDKKKTNVLNDEFLIALTPLFINHSNIKDNFSINENKDLSNPLFFVILMIKDVKEFKKSMLIKYFIFKNLRLLIFYLVFDIFLIGTFYLISSKFFDYLISSITLIQENFTNYNNSSKIRQSENFLLLENSEKIKYLEEEKKIFEKFLLDQTTAKNKEMLDLEKTFDTMKKIIFLKKIITNNNLQYHKKNFIKFLETIKDEEIREISTLMLAYSNFQESKYFSAMREIDSLILKITQKQFKLVESTDNFDAQIKDMITRFSEIAYVNEYSNFNGLNEAILPIIKAKQLSQKLFYLLAICKYRHIVGSRGNLLKKPNNKENNNFPLEEAMDYFKKVRSINHSIGMNLIKEIYSLIMLAKCNIYHHDCKAAKNILNEALLFYNEILKLFKDNYNKYFLPKIMLFTFNFIFQNLMLTIAQSLYENYRLCNAGYICYKIFETSPFLHKTIHKEASLLLCNIIRDIKNDYLGPNNIMDRSMGTSNSMNFRLRKKTTDRQDNQKLMNILNNKFRLFNKIYYRLGMKKQNMKKKDFNTTTTCTNNGFHKETTLKETKMSNLNCVSNDNLFINNSMKEIIICISEKSILSFHNSELLDVLIKYLQTFFGNNENDLFSYIQFSSSGKKTVFIRRLEINQYIEKLQNNKNNTILDTQPNQKVQFKQLYNILETCVKSVPTDVKSDNIIILFIESEDIRFSSVNECVDIVNELNEGNFTLIIFSCEEIINEKKLENIKMFLSGLTEGYFLHTKNYQMIKQVFMNIASNEKMEDFFNYEYENVKDILI